MQKKKIAIVLTNLGGPDSLKNVKKFLFNLFYDKAIINLSNPFRFFIAKIISNARNKKAKNIYKLMGGKSPILLNTLKQCKALKEKFNESNCDVIVIPAMRYWRPFTKDAFNAVKSFDPNKVILLPLYPHYSTTTTQSSIDEWLKLNNKDNISTIIIDNYCVDEDFIKAYVKNIEAKINSIDDKKNIILIFSAHSLPQKVIDAGDPYQMQIEQSVNKIMLSFKDIEHVISYQSKVGPLKWLEPSTSFQIEKFAKENRIICVVPISFVSEHSETLVELDIEYKELALQLGAKEYLRVDTLGDNPLYIDCLYNVVMRNLT